MARASSAGDEYERRTDLTVAGSGRSYRQVTDRIDWPRPPAPGEVAAANQSNGEKQVDSRMRVGTEQTRCVRLDAALVPHGLDRCPHAWTDRVVGKHAASVFLAYAVRMRITPLKDTS